MVFLFLLVFTVIWCDPDSCREVFRKFSIFSGERMFFLFDVTYDI